MEKLVYLSVSVAQKLNSLRAPHESDDGLVLRLIAAYEASLKPEPRPAYDNLDLVHDFEDVVNRLKKQPNWTVTLATEHKPLTVTLRKSRRNTEENGDYYISLPNQQTLRADEWGKVRGSYGQYLSKPSRALDAWCQGTLEEIKPLATTTDQTQVTVEANGDHLRFDFPYSHDAHTHPEVIFQLDEVLDFLKEVQAQGEGIDSAYRQAPERMAVQRRLETIEPLAKYLEQAGILEGDGSAKPLPYRLPSDWTPDKDSLRDELLDFEQHR